MDKREVIRQLTALHDRMVSGGNILPDNQLIGAVFEAAGQPRTWRVIPDADHVDYERLGGDPLRAEVGAFFARGLLPSP